MPIGWGLVLESGALRDLGLSNIIAIIIFGTRSLEFESFFVGSDGGVRIREADLA